MSATLPPGRSLNIAMSSSPSGPEDLALWAFSQPARARDDARASMRTVRMARGRLQCACPPKYARSRGDEVGCSRCSSRAVRCDAWFMRDRARGVESVARNRRALDLALHRWMRRYQGVLLDVDGTLVDSNDAHAQAWVEALVKHVYEITVPRARSLVGMGGDKLIELVTGLAVGSRENERISSARSELFKAKWLRAVEPARTVMIGDTPYDVRAARDASVDIIAGTCGGWSVEALAGARGRAQGHWAPCPRLLLDRLVVADPG